MEIEREGERPRVTWCSTSKKEFLTDQRGLEYRRERNCQQTREELSTCQSALINTSLSDQSVSKNFPLKSRPVNLRQIPVTPKQIAVGEVQQISTPISCSNEFQLASEFNRVYRENEIPSKSTFIELRNSEETNEFRKLNSIFRQLVDNLFARNSGSFDGCSNYSMGSNNQDTDSLKSRLHRNLWIASFFDWSTVSQLAFNSVSNALTLLQHFSGEAPTSALIRLDEQLEMVFREKSPRNSNQVSTRNFDSSSNSPQILPAIQDSFGPSAAKDLDIMEDSMSNVTEDLYERPTSWVQSILQPEEDHSKRGSNPAYQRTVTSYFEPISLDEAPPLPPINNLQRREDYRETHLIYHTSAQTVATMSGTSYTGNWNAVDEKETFGWNEIN